MQAQTILVPEDQFADEIGQSKRSIERWRRIGFGPRYVKLGRRVLYRRCDIDQWLESRVRQHTAEQAQGAL
ncbi:MAG: helix-turn-helix domain-containing protein [Luteitalea sp.]|nr:helix-turn-helix domain-containing protein [Luteitalea sp.]